MKKIIYTFIFLLPILLLSCSGSSNEAELKRQLEIAEQKNQELIQKAEAKSKVDGDAKTKSDAEPKAIQEADAKAKAEAELNTDSSYKEILQNYPNMMAGVIGNIKSERTPTLRNVYIISIIRYDDSFSSQNNSDFRADNYQCIAEQSQQLDSMLKSDLELVVSGNWLKSSPYSIDYCEIQYIKVDNKFLNLNSAEPTAKSKSEAKTKSEAEAKAKAEAKTKAEAEAKAKTEAEAKTKSEAEAKAKSEANIDPKIKEGLKSYSSYKEILNNYPNMMAGVIDNIKSERTPTLRNIYIISIIRYDDSFLTEKDRLSNYDCIADQSQQLDSILKSDLDLVVTGDYITSTYPAEISFCKIEYIKADNKFLNVSNTEPAAKAKVEVDPKAKVGLKSYSSHEEILNDNPNMLAGTADKLLWNLESGTLEVVDVLWIIRSDDSFTYPTSTQETWACRLAKYQPKNIFDVHLDYSVLNDLEVVVTGELKDSWNENTINNCKIQYIKVNDNYLDISDVKTIDFLENEFSQNKIIATKTYINKKIILSGIIAKVDYFSDSLFQEKAGFSVSSGLSELTCFLSKESDAEILNTDQKIIFEGVLDSYVDDWGAQMKFKSCSVLSTIK